MYIYLESLIVKLVINLIILYKQFNNINIITNEKFHVY